MLFTSFEGSEMVLHIDFQDIQAHVPLPKFGFQNMFLTSKNQKSFVWATDHVRQIYNI